MKCCQSIVCTDRQTDTQDEGLRFRVRISVPETSSGILFARTKRFFKVSGAALTSASTLGQSVSRTALLTDGDLFVKRACGLLQIRAGCCILGHFAPFLDSAACQLPPPPTCKGVVFCTAPPQITGVSVVLKNGRALQSDVLTTCWDINEVVFASSMIHHALDHHGAVVD